MRKGIKKGLVALSLAMAMGIQILPAGSPLSVMQEVEAADATSVTAFARTSTTGGKVTIKRVASATKYQIRYASNSSFTDCEKLQTASLTKSLSSTNIFRDSKDAYVSVRTYDGSKWSSWSSAKKLTTSSDYVWKKVKLKDAWVETKIVTVYIIDGKEYSTAEEASQVQKELMLKIDSGVLPEDYDIRIVNDSVSKTISHPATYTYRWTKVA